MTLRGWAFEQRFESRLLAVPDDPAHLPTKQQPSSMVEPLNAFVG